MRLILTALTAALTYRLLSLLEPHAAALTWLTENREQLEMNIIDGQVRRNSRLFTALRERA